MKLKKYTGNPVLRPTQGGNWEKHAVCNPGAFYDKDKVYMLYRASAETDIYRIYMGLAVSEDGLHFKRASSKPIYTPTYLFEAGGVEDARIVKFGDYYYITYACRAVPYTMFVTGKGPEYSERAPKSLKENLTRTGLLRTKDFRDFESLGAISHDDVDDRDVVIFPERIKGRYVMLHRPAEWQGPGYACEKPSIWMRSSDSLTVWEEKSVLLAQPDPEAPWQEKKIGASAPPIRTKYGWLLLYHGVQGDKPGRYYRQGVMMLDLEDPRRIISRPKDFILEPTEQFEKEGVEENVVFAVGNVVIGDEYFCYYGGADKVICVATAKFKDLVEFAMSEPVKR